MSLTDFRALGRSGLVVSPLCLGAMTFGPVEWGADEAASREIFDAYRDAGGNFVDTADTGRLSGANPFGDSKFTEPNWAILATLREVAAELDCTQAQAALAWAMSRPGVASTLGGARTVAQLEGNVVAASLRLTENQMNRLNRASTPTPGFTSSLGSPAIRSMLYGGHDVTGWGE